MSVNDYRRDRDPLRPLSTEHVPITILVAVEEGVLSQEDVKNYYGEHLRECEQCRNALEYAASLRASKNEERV